MLALLLALNAGPAALPDDDLAKLWTTSSFAEVSSLIASMISEETLARRDVAKRLVLKLPDRTTVKVTDNSMINVEGRPPAPPGAHVVDLTKHDLYTVAGRAAYALETALKVRLPEVSERLTVAQRTVNTAVIERYVSQFSDIADVLYDPDYRIVSAAVRKWQRAAPWDRVRAAELLAILVSTDEYIGLEHNTELDVSGRNFQGGPQKPNRILAIHDVYLVGGRAQWFVQLLVGPGVVVPAFKPGDWAKEPKPSISSGIVAAYRAGVEQAIGPPKRP